jgi:hypothetical protein
VIAFALFVLWVVVALGALRVQVDIIKADPSEMPGGGAWFVVLRSFAWPLFVALALVVLVAMGIEELLGGPRR